MEGKEVNDSNGTYDKWEVSVTEYPKVKFKFSTIDNLCKHIILPKESPVNGKDCYNTANDTVETVHQVYFYATVVVEVQYKILDCPFKDANCFISHQLMHIWISDMVRDGLSDTSSALLMLPVMSSVYELHGKIDYGSKLMESNDTCACLCQAIPCCQGKLIDYITQSSLDLLEITKANELISLIITNNSLF